jgi:proline iminopeptidase
VLVGALDPAPTVRCGDELTRRFRNAQLLVQPGAGHFPWIDGAELFAKRPADFLS